MAEKAAAGRYRFSREPDRETSAIMAAMSTRPPQSAAENGVPSHTAAMTMAPTG